LGLFGAPERIKIMSKREEFRKELFDHANMVREWVLGDYGHTLTKEYTNMVVHLEGNDLIDWVAQVMFPTDPDKPENRLSIMREDHLPRIDELYMNGYLNSIKPRTIPGAKFFYEKEYDEEFNDE
jgi:hypothetical protein